MGDGVHIMVIMPAATPSSWITLGMIVTLYVRGDHDSYTPKVATQDEYNNILAY